MPIWAKICALFIPVVFFIIGIFAARETWQFQSDSIQTTAEIVSIRYEYGSRTGHDGFSEDTSSAYPMLKFTDHNNNIHLAESSQPASGFEPVEGLIIPVRYWEPNPQWVRPAFSWWSLWAGPVLFLGIGLGTMILLGFIFRIISRADLKSNGLKRI